MRRRKISVALFSLMIAVTGTFHGHMNVSAATKKFSVKQPYENATRIKGKVKKGCQVTVTIDKKTYKAKVTSNGNYTIKVPKIKIGKRYRLTAYQKKKVYAKKSFYALVKTIKVNPFTEKDHVFSGYAANQARVVLKCKDTSYITTSSASGYWKIDTKKALGRNNISIKIYKNGKKIASYQKTYDKVNNSKTDTSQNTTQEHKHVYDIPVYVSAHYPMIGHYETITDPGGYSPKEVTHDFCKKCNKDLTQEYVDGIKDRKYMLVDIPKNKDTSKNKTREILEPYVDINWSDDFPMYEDYLAYGGWDHTCTDHELTQKNVTIMEYFSGAICKKWIVDQEEHDEKILVGYKCSCGNLKQEESK